MTRRYLPEPASGVKYIIPIEMGCCGVKLGNGHKLIIHGGVVVTVKPNGPRKRRDSRGRISD